DRAAFLVERDQRTGPHHVAQPARQGANGILVAEVVAEQDDRSNRVPPEELRLCIVERLARNADHDESARCDRHLTAPSMPRMKNRCAKKNTMSAGAIVSTAPAAITRVELPNVPDNSRMPTASGIRSLFVSTTLGHRKLFQVVTAVRITRAAICGSARGSMMRT